MDDLPPNMEEIEDTTYDVVVQGTGLEEALVAGSLARSGLKVLHIDANGTYGGDSATLTLKQFVATVDSSGGTIHKFPDYEAAEKARGWNIDVTPRGVASGGSFVDLLIESNSGRYLEFKNVDRNLILSKGTFVDLPSGRSAVFKSKHLAPMEKRRLMQLMQCCDPDATLPDGMLQKPVSEFLKGHLKMNENLQAMVLYAILGVSSLETQMDTATALQRLRVVAGSVGKYGPTNMLYANYGVSELCQSMCRVCAIYRGTYILKRSVACVNVSLSTEDNNSSHQICSVKCSAGQTFTCKHYVTSEASKVCQPDEEITPAETTEYRAVVISKLSIFAAVAMEEPEDDVDEDENAARRNSPYQTTFATIPPNGLSPGLPTRSVKIFEVSYSTNSCPTSYYCLHFTQSADGKQDELNKVVDHFVDQTTGAFKEEWVKAEEKGEAEGEKEEEEEEGEEHKKATLIAYFGSPSALVPKGVKMSEKAASVDGLYYTKAMGNEADVDSALTHAQEVFREVMFREVQVRGMELLPFFCEKFHRKKTAMYFI